MDNGKQYRENGVAKGAFITGTDTCVGKTTLACRLIATLEERGFHPAPRKPVESGCEHDDEGKPLAYDAARLAATMRSPPPLERICRYRLDATASPARAAMLAGARITLDDLVAACEHDPGEMLLVEGAGGLLSPIAQGHSNADLAVRLQLPLILVVADKLGCINHTLLTLAVAGWMGLKTLGIVLNRLPRDYDAPVEMDNFEDLRALTDVPLIKMKDIDRRQIYTLFPGLPHAQ